jgi:hypothetical protein
VSTNVVDTLGLPFRPSFSQWITFLSYLKDRNYLI